MPQQVPSLQALASQCVVRAFVQEAESSTASGALSPAQARRMATLAQLLCATGSLAQMPASFVNDLLAGSTNPSMSSKWTYGTLKAAFRNSDLSRVSLRGHLKAANLLPELSPGNFPGLTSLDLSNTTMSSSAPLRHTLLALAPQLCSLDLSRCRGLTSYALDAVYSCSRLQTLKLASTGAAITSVQFQRPPSAALAASASEDGWSVASSRRRRGGGRAAQQVAATEVAPPQQFPAFGKAVSSSSASSSSWGRGGGGWRSASMGGSWRDAAPPSPPPAAASGTFLAAGEHSSACEIVLSALPATLQHLDVSGCAGDAAAVAALPAILAKRCPQLLSLNAGYCAAASHPDVQLAWTQPSQGLVALQRLRELHLAGLEWSGGSQLALLQAAWGELQSLQLQPHEGAGTTYHAAAALPFYDLLQVPASSLQVQSLALLVALPSPDEGGSFPVGHCALDLIHAPLARVSELELFFTAAPVPPGQWRPHTSSDEAACPPAQTRTLSMHGHAAMQLDAGMVLAALPALDTLSISDCTVSARMWLPRVPLSVQNAAKRVLAGAASTHVDGETAAQAQADSACAQKHVCAAVRGRRLRALQLCGCSLAPGSLLSQLAMQPLLERTEFAQCRLCDDANLHVEPEYIAADVAPAPAWLTHVFRTEGGQAEEQLADASIAVTWGGDGGDSSDSDDDIDHIGAGAGVAGSFVWEGQEVAHEGGAAEEAALQGTPAAQYAELLSRICGSDLFPALQQLLARGAHDALLAAAAVLLRAAGAGVAADSGTPPPAQGGHTDASAIPSLDQLAAMWNIESAPTGALQVPRPDAGEHAPELPWAEVQLGLAAAAHRHSVLKWAQHAACDVLSIADV